MLETIDIVFRTVTVTTAVLLAGLLLSTGRRRQAALPGAFLSLAVAAFFVTSVPVSHAALGGWGVVLTALCVTKAAWFWLLARALFQDHARIRAWHLAIVGLIAAAGTWQQTVFLDQYRAGSATVWETVAGFGFEGTLLGFVLLGLNEAWRGMATDLIEQRRHLRIVFMVATGIYLSATLGIQTYNLVMDVSTPVLASRVNMAVAAVACLASAAFLLRFRSKSWLDPSPSTAAVALSRVESAVLSDLDRLLDTDRIFLQEGLTIGALADRLGTGEHVLRRVINRGMGYRNFNDFLNAWRIREACEELARPEQSRLPVLSIAMKVGYGSIGAFNRAFKSRIGMTPTDYRRSAVNGASHAR